jgi:hypothetical protein
MAIEIFGSPIAIYALIGCLMSYFTSGHVGIYHAQEMAKHKLHSLGKLGRYLKSMRKKSTPALIFFLAVFSVRAFAITIESETSLGREISGEDISGTGKFPNSNQKVKGNSYFWNLGYGSMRSTSTDTATGEKITDRTGDLNLGLGLETPGKWTADIGFDYSTTPDENLAEVGPGASIGYTYEFNGNDGFHRDITAKLLFASTEYAQTFTKAKARRKSVTRPTTGNNTIRENSVGLSLSSNVFEWLTVKIQSVKYSYNKDVVKFLAFLDSSRSVVSGRSGLSSTVTGLPDTESRLKLTFYIGEDWTV